jgi:hypothetical protein
MVSGTKVLVDIWFWDGQLDDDCTLEPKVI